MRKRARDVQGSIMRWLATGPATDVISLAAVMQLDREKVAGGVRRLQELGLVSFDYVKSPTGGRPMYGNIRLTDHGAQNIPDPVYHAQVGTTASTSGPSLRPNDPTDFRNHPTIAHGGAVTRTIITAKQTPPAVVVQRVQQTGSTIGASQYPILEALRERMASVEPLAKAARSLPKDDPLRAQLERRIEMEERNLNAIQREYARYAADHPHNH